MFSNFLKKIFGSRNQRLLKSYGQTVTRVNALEAAMKALTDAELTGKTAAFKARVASGETLEALLPEAFAVVREASSRVLQMRHFDVQLIGGMTLHNGKIAEMRTGEGKTLMATLPAYLNALSGKGVHVVTVNDYLAKRDADWMGQVYGFLGLQVGVILSQQDTETKKLAYAADITYGTNNEFGFDYLRDNMEYQLVDKRQRPLSFAIVDEVDSILIDEARTPLIISGQADDTTDLYNKVDVIVPKLVRQKEEESEGDFWVDEKQNQIILSEAGHEHAEELMAKAGLLEPGSSLYAAANIQLMHHLNAALRAHSLFHRDQQYVVQDDEVVIVDEFTGRLMSGRRWSDGLHQAVEAKERVAIQKENQTLASITFQNYFRMYSKLSGMTGTADTEAYEFKDIYGLETVIIPTHRPMVRKDNMDQVFRTSKERYDAVTADIRDCYERGQPVLVGTTSIETSELVSTLLDKQKLPHQVLNAKQHAREADVVAGAGAPKMITIATNMAGRGTDIVLGGNVEREITRVRADAGLDDQAREARISALRTEWQGLHEQVVNAGGLHIIGTERHESRRVDNQLRGRSGRQGDPGSSRFYLSLEDPLLRIFASDRVAAIMTRLKLPEGEAIEHVWVTRAIENAQRKVEARNFDIRKQLLEYDDVSNDQRKVVYQQRDELLAANDMQESVAAMRTDVLAAAIGQYIPPGSVHEQWDPSGLEKLLASEFNLDVPIVDMLAKDDELHEDALVERVMQASAAQYEAKLTNIEPQVMRQYERAVMLQSFDSHWREHLAALDHLRQGIHLRSYAQKNPKQEYKSDAFTMFSDMLDRIKADVTRTLMLVQIRSAEEVAQVDEPAQLRNVTYQHAEAIEALALAAADAGEVERMPDYGSELAMGGEKAQPFVRPMQKVGRNDPCPCGSGKKYKVCHGRLS